MWLRFSPKLGLTWDVLSANALHQHIASLWLRKGLCLAWQIGVVVPWGSAPKELDSGPWRQRDSDAGLEVPWSKDALGWWQHVTLVKPIMLRPLLTPASGYLLCSNSCGVCSPRPSVGTHIDLSWPKDRENVYSNNRYPPFQSPQ